MLSPIILISSCFLDAMLMLSFVQISLEVSSTSTSTFPRVLIMPPLLSLQMVTLVRYTIIVTTGSPIVRNRSQVADLGSAYKLAPQSLGLPQTERLSIGVLKSILKLREVSPLVWELYTVSRKGQVTKHK